MEENVDETCDIELEMTEAGLSRPEVVKAIQIHYGDVVIAILELDN